MRWLCVLILAFGLLPPVSATAQNSTAIELEPSGEAYLRAIRFRRINSGVRYFDPTGPAPPIETSEQPLPLTDEDDRTADGRSPQSLPTMLIAGAILLGIMFLFYRFGGSITLSTRSDAENAARIKSGGRATDFEELDGEPRSLETILNIKDRSEALVLLANRALASAVSANGVLLQRSWTARDALRRVPSAQAHLDALKALVMDSERAQFGGRDVSEAQFQDHVDRIRPLLREAEA